MSKEKFIRGKHDNGKHDGLYANTKRLIQAEQELQDFLLPDHGVIFEDNHTRHNENLARAHGFYYKGRYYHHGVAQPKKR